jgi:hypothetical protein
MMRKLMFTTAAALVLAAAALGMAASGAVAAGPQGPSCGTFRVREDQKIEGRLFPKGTYRLNAMGLSRAKVAGKYGLFDQFLGQDDATPLPKPWESLIGAVGAPKFSAAPGVGFRAQRIAASRRRAPSTARATNASGSMPVAAR